MNYLFHGEMVEYGLVSKGTYLTGAVFLIFALVAAGIAFFFGAAFTDVDFFGASLSLAF